MLVGPSGCGKSSLLMMLAGLRQQSAGTILCDGRPVTGPDPDRIGVVFQEANLFPWLTALDNVAFPLALRHVKPAERRRRALDMLRLVGWRASPARYPHELSGGMRQRVSIARGLVQDPPVLLMDEPFAALDEQTRMTMGDELLRIWSETRKTVVFVTHSLTEAVYLADEVLVMSARPGRIIDRIEVDLPRPRSLRNDGDAAFRPAARSHLAAHPVVACGLTIDVHSRRRRRCRWIIIAAARWCCGRCCRASARSRRCSCRRCRTQSVRVLVTDWPEYADALVVTLARGRASPCCSPAAAASWPAR